MKIVSMVTLALALALFGCQGIEEGSETKLFGGNDPKEVVLKRENLLDLVRPGLLAAVKAYASDSNRDREGVFSKIHASETSIRFSEGVVNATARNGAELFPCTQDSKILVEAPCRITKPSVLVSNPKSFKAIAAGKKVFVNWVLLEDSTSGAKFLVKAELVTFELRTSTTLGMRQLQVVDTWSEDDLTRSGFKPSVFSEILSCDFRSKGSVRGGRSNYEVVNCVIRG